MSSDEHSATLDQAANEFDAYQGMNRTAIAACGLGLASAVVMTGVAVLAALPLAGLFCGLYALRQLADPERKQVGRPLALAGVSLSTIFLVGGPCHAWMDGRWLSREAQPIAAQWFEYLRRGEPQRALQLEQPPLQRRPFDDALVEYYRSPESFQQLKGFVKQPLVRLLLELKDQTQVRYCQTLRVGRGTNKDEVTLLYSISFPLDAHRTTMFVYVGLERRGASKSDVNRWTVVEYGAAVSPLETR